MYHVITANGALLAIFINGGDAWGYAEDKARKSNMAVSWEGDKTLRIRSRDPEPGPGAGGQ